MWHLTVYIRSSSIQIILYWKWEKFKLFIASHPLIYYWLCSTFCSMLLYSAESWSWLTVVSKMGLFLYSRCEVFKWRIFPRVLWRPSWIRSWGWCFCYCLRVCDSAAVGNDENNDYDVMLTPFYHRLFLHTVTLSLLVQTQRLWGNLHHTETNLTIRDTSHPRHHHWANMASLAAQQS